mgnify:CR=1 FL=1
MCRLLVIFEYSEPGRVPDVAAAVAASAERDGAEVRLRDLEATVWREISWADGLAFGIDGGGANLPDEAGRWLDTLGCNGWIHLSDKAGCVFAIRGDANESGGASRAVARILRARGMETVTATELGVSEPPHDDGGTAIGQSFVQWCLRLEAAQPQPPGE